MTQQIATDPSQSARLIACGVDPSTADMGRILGGCDNPGCFQEICNINEYEYWSGHMARGLCAGPDGKPLEIQPPLPYRIEYAWSLGRILALLPKDLMWQGLYYRLVMGPNENRWEIEYNDLSVMNNLHRVKAESIIEAVVRMIEWLTQNEYKLNEIKK